MGVESFARYVTIALFTILFLVVATRASRQRNRVWIETSLFFACVTLLMIDSWSLPPIGTQSHHRLPSAVDIALIVTMAFLLARLLNTMSVIPRTILRASEVGFVILVVAPFVVPDVDSPVIILPVVAYFAVVVVFTAVVTASEGIRMTGVTRRRLLAVALGSLFLSSGVVLAGIRAAFPSVAGIPHSLVNGPLALAAGVSYFVGFATPRFLRHSWQDQVLREFFSRTVALPRLADRDEIVFGLELGARRAVGGLSAWIGLWEPEHDVLCFLNRADGVKEILPGQMIEGKAFARQRTVVSVNLARDDPNNAALYRELGVNSVICAPISAGDQRIGVLAVYLMRAPVFVVDDAEVIRLLADQSAIIIESHALIHQSARLRAREEATRLKDDFLAAAAHDLKTPLAALIMQAQLLDRRAHRHPSAPTDRQGVQNLVAQANRLQAFVSDLLDVQRIESQGLTVDPGEIDLAELVGQTIRQIPAPGHTVTLEVRSPVSLTADRARITQLIDNLVSNAVKYSPDGGEISLRLWREETDVHLTVRDHGIGIPAADLPFVFDRFHRAGNAEGTQLHGVGLGLFICKAVVEAHGGAITVASEQGEGTEFHVVLPERPGRLSRRARPRRSAPRPGQSVRAGQVSRAPVAADLSASGSDRSALH
jgi:signal transduction histidine kinase